MEFAVLSCAIVFFQRIERLDRGCLCLRSVCLF
jgi:hypothetical protein